MVFNSAQDTTKQTDSAHILLFWRRQIPLLFFLTVIIVIVVLAAMLLVCHNLTMVILVFNLYGIIIISQPGTAQSNRVTSTTNTECRATITGATVAALHIHLCIATTMTMAGAAKLKIYGSWQPCSPRAAACFRCTTAECWCSSTIMMGSHSARQGKPLRGHAEWGWRSSQKWRTGFQELQWEGRSIKRRQTNSRTDWKLRTARRYWIYISKRRRKTGGSI